MTSEALDRVTSERLLDGRLVDSPANPLPVARLLTAARAAPRPGELTGEGRAVLAFRRARAALAAMQSPTAAGVQSAPTAGVQSPPVAGA